MKKFLLVSFLSLLALCVHGQSRVISGKVTSSEDGTALPGVNVEVKGTANGTVTDSNGQFKLKIQSADEVLLFSFIGYQTSEAAVDERSIFDAALVSDVKQLAVGIEVDRCELGYALQTVKARDVVSSFNN